MTSLEYPYHVDINENRHLIENDEELFELMSTTLGNTKGYPDIINDILDVDSNNKIL